MKRLLFGLSMMLAAILILSACKEDLTNEEFENGSATIQGTAYANLDYTNDTGGTEYEFVPEGTRIYAIINAVDLVSSPSPQVDYGQIIYETTVTAGGSFSFTVDANIEPVTVSFSADDFSANQVQPDASTMQQVFFLPDGYMESVRSGMTKITQVYFVEK